MSVFLIIGQSIVSEERWGLHLAAGDDAESVRRSYLTYDTIRIVPLIGSGPNTVFDLDSLCAPRDRESLYVFEGMLEGLILFGTRDQQPLLRLIEKLLDASFLRGKIVGEYEGIFSATRRGPDSDPVRRLAGIDGYANERLDALESFANGTDYHDPLPVS